MRELKILPLSKTEVKIETSECVIIVRVEKDNKTSVYRRMKYMGAPLEFLRNAEGY